MVVVRSLFVLIFQTLVDRRHGSVAYFAKNVWTIPLKALNTTRGDAGDALSCGIPKMSVWGTHGNKGMNGRRRHQYNIFKPHYLSIEQCVPELWEHALSLTRPCVCPGCYCENQNATVRSIFLSDWHMPNWCTPNQNPSNPSNLFPENKINTYFQYLKPLEETCTLP